MWFLFVRECHRLSYLLWGLEPILQGAYSGTNRRSVGMARWTLYRERSQRKRKVLLLLTLSGVIRPAGVEQRYFGGVATGAHQNGPSWAADPIPLAETSQTAIVGSS